jgi:hypothetical protein
MKTKKLKNSFDEFLDGIDKDRLVLLKKLNEFIKTLNSKNNDDVIKAIENIKIPKPPNFPEIPKPPKKVEAKILNELKIKKPEWFEMPKLERVEKLLLSLTEKKPEHKAVIGEIKNILKELQKKENAIAVRLTSSDQTFFYNAMMNAYGAASATAAEASNIATAATIYNITMTNADTEYNQAITAKSITIQCRGSYDVKISFALGQSGINYLTIKSGQNYFENTLNASITVYAQCATAGQVLEIIAWN